MSTKFATPLIAACAAVFCAGAQADTGKLLLTGGVSTIEGAAGGGLTPWAVIGSNATEGEIGGSAYATRVNTKDYGLNVYGAAVGIQDRAELSIAQQDFNTRGTGTALGLPDLHLKQTIVGAKVRVLGDAVLDSDSLVPQVAVGVQYKTLGSTGLDGTLNALGAKRQGTDFYVSATKLFLGQSLLLNGTLRATKANQNGLLGYGATLGGDESRYSLQPEVSVAYLLSKNVAVGAEYRFMRNKLETAGKAAGLGNGLRAGDWKDIFIAWAPTKNVSLTLAYVDLGVIVPATTASRKQTGYYLSAQVAF
ncbi:MAG: DUF3034 family protein [Polaromonas sp.]|uniref:DUF3034 family protein n=1 Tax=Polaromonas sp. TaxID=1869339 RepID=UPI00272F2B73|nr:DUF3034 family protein [Polaromonas sp.]MDP2254962.1 DUF3034 family protein [Polaromonas sp.]MDP3706863.1 DUF3034 family protein [Polaromonas sp.]